MVGRKEGGKAGSDKGRKRKENKKKRKTRLEV
jgi:hypothetical protein